MNVDHKINIDAASSTKPHRSKRWLALAAVLAALLLSLAIALPLTLVSHDDKETNEGTNKGTNEGTNEGTNKGTNEGTNSQRVEGCYLDNNTRCDLVFGNDPLQKLDLYETSAAAEGMPPAPCILYVHGGGWKGGDKDTNENPPAWILDLRQHGYHIASTNYRLTSNGDTHPAQIQDVESAVVYLKKHAATLNLNPHKIVALGTSAGGHLVSLLGTRNGPESEARVAGVINLFGGTILYEEDKIPTKLLFGCKTPSNPNAPCYADALDASPFTQVAASNPPHLILHGEDDPTVPVNASIRFQDQLESVGANSTLLIVPGVGHDKDRVACGQTDGLVNTEHIYRWINATVSPRASCDSVVCGGGTHYGDALDLYDDADAFLSPYCLNVRLYGSTGNGGDYGD